MKTPDEKPHENVLEIRLDSDPVPDAQVDRTSMLVRFIFGPRERIEISPGVFFAGQPTRDEVQLRSAINDAVKAWRREQRLLLFQNLFIEKAVN